MAESDALTLLVLCTGNSARSILREVLINELSDGCLQAFSAGSKPVGQVNPGALAQLVRAGHGTAGLASKSWNRFSGPGAPAIDIVITVCDAAAGESCPIWNGAPVTVHWGIEDPAGAADVESAFEAAYYRLRKRVELMLELPLANFDMRMRRESLQRIHDSFAGPDND